MKYDSIIILGATATGKTALSVRLASKLNGEIINADSQQIYKHLNIGTAKVTPDEMGNVKHHLFDIINVGNEFSVADYKMLATQKITELKSKNILPVIVGGTGFYIDSLLYKLELGNTEKQPELRQYYEDLAKTNGNEFIHNILKEVDPESAKKLHPNDLKRVIRAIEIAKTSNLKKSQQIKQKDDFINPFIINVCCDREILYNRINFRVEKMLNEGLLEEVKWLKNQGFYNQTCDVKLPIGYSEWSGVFNENLSQNDVVELIKQHTRNYAKRQITWFKKYEPHINIDLTKTDLNTALQNILALFCE